MDAIVLNFPIDIAFKSTNPFGWPRLVISIYGLDAFGRDVIRGYGSVHLPTVAGSNTVREVPLFRPLSSSLLQQFIAWLSGSPPEVDAFPLVTCAGLSSQLTLCFPQSASISTPSSSRKATDAKSRA